MDVVFLNHTRLRDGYRLVQVPPHVLCYFRTQENLRPFHREPQCHDGRVPADRPPVTLCLDGSRYEIVKELVV